MHAHIGSQISSSESFVSLATTMAKFYKELKNKYISEADRIAKCFREYQKNYRKKKNSSKRKTRE